MVAAFEAEAPKTIEQYGAPTLKLEEQDDDLNLNETSLEVLKAEV